MLLTLHALCQEGNWNCFLRNVAIANTINKPDVFDYSLIWHCLQGGFDSHGIGTGAGGRRAFQKASHSESPSLGTTVGLVVESLSEHFLPVSASSWTDQWYVSWLWPFFDTRASGNRQKARGGATSFVSPAQTFRPNMFCAGHQEAEAANKPEAEMEEAMKWIELWGFWRFVELWELFFLRSFEVPFHGFGFETPKDSLICKSFTHGTW